MFRKGDIIHNGYGTIRIIVKVTPTRYYCPQVGLRNHDYHLSCTYVEANYSLVYGFNDYYNEIQER